MNKQLLVQLILIGFSSFGYAVEPGQILPLTANYDPSITSPADFFGFAVGSRHLYHHQIVNYCRHLANESDRVSVVEYAHSYGARPLLYLMITSAENHSNIGAIQARQVELCDPERSAGFVTESMPAVIYMGYSVHGNEPSGGNAAALVAFHLAASRGAEHKRLLDDTIILLDPCLNPDGFERFAHWANNHRGNVLNADPNHLEHREPSPSGRTNYYWFDLNRDWLPAQHPESQGRLAVFYRWRPNVVLDFHEMGTNATYFFQPGVTKRYHPLTPRRARELTQTFGKYHAEAMDGIGSLYFTEEKFDDFYMGKGSTYPDLHGAIGILFEQASARGHIQESVNGPLSFPFAIRNHFVTSMSSLKATQDNRKELLEQMRVFYQDSAALARSSETQGYVVAAPGDPARLRRFLHVLDRHQIRAYRLTKPWTVGGITFAENDSYVVPAQQPEFRYLKALFERRTEFEENIFYDVSTWTLPLAFNLRHARLVEPASSDYLGDRFDTESFDLKPLQTDPLDVAYVMDWRGYFAPKMLYQLLKNDVVAKVATRPFTIKTAAGPESFAPGAIVIPVGVQQERRELIAGIVAAGHRDGIAVRAALSGLTPDGIDLGSSDMIRLEKPSLLLLSGAGTNSYEVGEVWHLLDRRVEMPVTMMRGSEVAAADLADYSAIVLAGGNHASLKASGIEKIKQFLSDGGTIIAIGSAIRWLNSNKIVSVRFREAAAKPDQPVKRRPYVEAGDDAAFRLVRGAIFETQVDTTHPIGYGFPANESLPVFRNNNVFLELAKNRYSTPVAYSDEPLISGYVSEENLRLLSKSASVVVQTSGRGRVVLFADNPNFRAFWYGTNRLFLNAIFFGPMIRTP